MFFKLLEFSETSRSTKLTLMKGYRLTDKANSRKYDVTRYVVHQWHRKRHANQKCHMAPPYHKNDKMPVPSGPSLTDHLTFYSAQRLDLFAWRVRLSRLLVGFQTHFKSLHFHFITAILSAAWRIGQEAWIWFFWRFQATGKFDS